MPSARPQFSRLLVCLFLLVAERLTVGRATSLHAQVPPDTVRRVADSVAIDSLRARLERAEAAIALLREQLGIESESAVKTRSRSRFELSAQVLTNLFITNGRANIVDVPQTVLAPTNPSGTGGRERALGFSLRQTRIGAAAFVDDVFGGAFAGDIDFDLFGGAQGGPGDRRLFPEPRLRTARARVIWSRTEIMVGQETPLISDLNPISFAGVGIPVFSGSGNLWNWLGQIRLTQEIARFGRSDSRQLRLAATGAVMSPYASTIAPGEPDAVDAGERSSRPAFEGRLSARWGGLESETISGGLIGRPGGEIGVGAHRGWIAMPDGRLEASRALSADARAVLARGLEVRGEAYQGRLLRGLGGGGIAQNFGNPPTGAPSGTLGAPIRDVAGWLQVNVQPHPVLLSGLGCGIDLVDAGADPARRQNTVCAVHAAWRPMQPLVIGVEFRRLGTRFSSGTYGAQHFNLAFGFEL